MSWDAQIRKAQARETVEILDAGRYVSPSGEVVRIDLPLHAAIAGSRLYRPQDFPEPLPGCAQQQQLSTVVDVTPETTLDALQRLASTDPVCLNFASARNPGGGFLSGAQAQEESLARSSGLYPCIRQMSEMYHYNRNRRTMLYSDHMIYSPRVPIFRDDKGELLDAQYAASIITAPAVNAGALRRNDPIEVPLIRPTMAARLRKVLWVASTHKHQTIVLGAWGCGVFGNDPQMVAELFRETLGPGGPFERCFERVVYAVFDRSPGGRTLAAFERSLGHTNDWWGSKRHIFSAKVTFEGTVVYPVSVYVR
jgi:uncharacterized protein (TIGR02452 family)